MKNAAYDYKCVDDNMRCLKKWGSKHRLVMIIKRIKNYTQCLQFGRRDDSYLRRFITIIKEQPLKWRGIFDDELLSFKTNSNALKVSDFIWRQLIPISIPKTISKRSRAGQLEWMMLCNEAFDIRTCTSESFLRNGSRRFSTRLSGR